VEFPFKPVALINASSMATHAHASLVETLTTMNANVVRDACVTIPVARGEMDATGAIASPAIRDQVRRMLDVFTREIRALAQ
jgi:hypothetical protein